MSSGTIMLKTIPMLGTLYQTASDVGRPDTKT